MITFTLAHEVLRDGGCLIVDEIENHFNKEIVSTLIRFFMDGKLNKNGGMLIFSTHMIVTTVFLLSEIEMELQQKIFPIF